MIPALWKLYCDSFPMEERRRQRSQQQIEKNPKYHIETLLQGKEAIGMICYWDFKAFCFIEHFAIDSTQRGKGLGKQFLQDFIKTRKSPIVLEVEPAGADEENDSERHKRIHFYEGAGFTLSGFSYLQPPYEKTHMPVPLEWMTLGLEINHELKEHQLAEHNALFLKWKQILFKEVYGVE